MNKEIYYEGWLIKSPPTKRIWRARWRRRWFTLKQGEIPEQFCLEYYADRKCRKLKGVIDLDQCEQVDCGLRLENRKQKFQFMFDIKTPKRTYYLAADTETDMRDWVNCICQVCHLHDTKQSQDENRTQNLATTIHTNSSNDTTTTTINSSSGTNVGGGNNTPQSFNHDILRKPPNVVVEQQPLTSAAAASCNHLNATTSTNAADDSSRAYVNTEYSNRETVLCDVQFEKQQLANVVNKQPQQRQSQQKTHHQQQQQQHNRQQQPQTASSAVYLNTDMFQDSSRLAVSSNGVVRKIPENLVINNTPLTDTQQHSVQPSPALSTASGPYIPISECYSGSPKFLLEANTHPSTPLNNLDPKFYDTPRSHNNIGLNLTNVQSYSPKITNCGTQQPVNVSKNRSHKSDSDSESVFTDDDEWAHPMPLREHMDRNTRPSDSSVENESFVLTYSQRFSKLPDDASKELKNITNNSAHNSNECLEKLAKVLKNKNNLILDFKDNEKSSTRDMPQFSDTENTSPAIIGPRDARSVVDESYDIPRSHQLPYCNMANIMDKITSPDANPIAASTPNLMASIESVPSSPASVISQLSSNVRTLPRPHCYTNAAPSKVEGNVFRYDFVEQTNVPPVNRKLKPKLSVEADKPPEEVAAKPPQLTSQVDHLANRLQTTQIQSPAGLVGGGVAVAASGNVVAGAKSHTENYGVFVGGGFIGTPGAPDNNLPQKPPSVDRKNKPNAYKIGNSNTLGNNTRRTTGAPLSMVLPNEQELPPSYAMETRTLPRQPKPNYALNQTNATSFSMSSSSQCNTPTMFVMHQRTASANAAMHHLTAAAAAATAKQQAAKQPMTKNEHRLQYFELDVANAPPISRQSVNMSTSSNSINASTLNNSNINRLALAADPARAPVQSKVVYKSVDFIKTEAFKRIREEREIENESHIKK
ncbi:protein daughter of sevenless isoform X1 [Stomoxys calcitrans]|uniref:protein daughter of sevenless isoform X1 n=1 Tax=Stomoxys calcitrans TaxID=35570 RepID=UPI0027E34889|nr:protein daughter of sevenless isoform X1 [Stomoxys calcitrans]XP_013112078.2 protein daughter of sevenless isoform X1 [Stomoxys calcitrans]XP_013112080.2 protein daughter of sevenless isoform X1 [Stomoxys calcitrans]